MLTYQTEQETFEWWLDSLSCLLIYTLSGRQYDDDQYIKMTIFIASSWVGETLTDCRVFLLTEKVDIDWSAVGDRPNVSIITVIISTVRCSMSHPTQIYPIQSHVQHHRAICESITDWRNPALLTESISQMHFAESIIAELARRVETQHIDAVDRAAALAHSNTLFCRYQN